MIGPKTIVCLAAGVVLGTLFFGGLWITVRRLATSRHPGALAAGSLMVRTAAVVIGVLLLTRGRWQNALAILFGFIAARIAVSRVVARCT